MTKEKILQTFEDINLVYNNCTRYDTLKRMLDELQEPCEDCISRQAVLDAINTDFHEDLSQLEDAIKALPPVDPKQKMGHWIKYGIPRCGEQHYQCTSCGYYINFGQWGELYSKEFKYCPNCKARMVESQESEGDKEKLSWLGKNCKDCGNKKCKELGELPKGYDCALWQAESEE